jgi:hypothetical protein
MSNYENAALVLRTADLTANATTQVGICDQNKTNFTWNNINLRTVLGSMYDTYDKFNICLNTVSTSQVNAGSIPGTAYDDRIVQIYMSGLPFINQCYDVVKGCNIKYTIIGTFNFPSVTACTTQYFYSSNIATFDKRQDLINIQIFYSRISKNGGGTYDIATANVFPDMIFIFDIFGIPKTEFNNGTRIKNLT